MQSYENTKMTREVAGAGADNSYLLVKPFNDFILGFLRRNVRHKYPDAEIHGHSLGYYWIDAGAGMNFKVLTDNCKTQLVAWWQAWRKVSHDIL